MKNLVVILLLLIFSATQFGSLFSDICAPVIHVICYDKVFRKGLSSSRDQTFVIDTATFRQSLTDDREIRLDGELFDIVSVTNQGSGVLLRVSSDKFETQFFNIFQQIRDAVNKTSGPHHHNKELQSWLLKLYCPNEATANLLLPAVINGSYQRRHIPGLTAGVHNRHLQPPDISI